MKKLASIFFVILLTSSCMKQGVPPGAIVAFGGDTANVPEGWLLCNGDTLSRIGKYENLFNSIGTHWGGKATTDFVLPDLRGQFLRGVDDGAGNDPDSKNRTELISGDSIGDKVGSYQEDAFQVHQHNFWPFSHTGEGPIKNGAHTPWETAACLQPTIGIIGEGDDQPRTAYETRPKNAYVNFIIKY